jgi:hypothetical protein
MGRVYAMPAADAAVTTLEINRRLDQDGTVHRDDL